MIDTKRVLSFDWLLLLLTALLAGLGVLLISSATATMRAAGVALADLPAVRQAAFAALGLLALVGVSLLDYRVWASLRWMMYAGILVLLAGVQIIGHTVFGAQSWFNLVVVNVQPSELAKIVLILFMARYLADHEEQVKQGSALLVSLLLIAPLVGLIAAEPDLGTAAVLFAVWAGMLFVAGLRPQHIVIMALTVIVLAPLAWTVMPDHAQDRIMMFVKPDSVSDDKLYNVLQALIGIGSGGLWGKGLGLGTQSQLSFLRVRHTDYIFAVLAEELGFVGSMLLLGLFTGLLMRIIHIGAKAADAYGRLIATGVFTMIFVQIFINIGFHVRLLPVTGLPLPLISYGGSSLITTLLGLGLVESVALYHQPREVVD
ncbi:MAG TPA: FtsW/RodA/SpoVE family cell cycle protein [Anaerolineae bacterium]|nr:FtsW/RodA/SpoVE family cell cycle protein [Anaerolineae bacterium]HOQ98724.1 FtsW/RodA/SpoVE family cell cycle protein [Anaerolineae bacterium]HPL30098.1 FtsW/RodA/SpoVE family cell cycle protein [Anaerolineae bacterium]